MERQRLKFIQLKLKQQHTEDILRKEEIILQLKEDVKKKDSDLTQAINSKMDSLQKLNEYLNKHKSASATSTPRRAKLNKNGKMFVD